MSGEATALALSHTVLVAVCGKHPLLQLLGTYIPCIQP